MKPMLASDFDESKVPFPIGVQPKVDGVRALSPGGAFVGRSGKTFGNRYITAFFSQPEYAWIDGELAAEKETHPDLCRVTTSAVSTHEGQPYLLWHAFDYLHPDVVHLPYADRHKALLYHVKSLWDQGKGLHLRVVPLSIVNNMHELLAYEEACLLLGYEGIILRRLDGKHKQGRSTVREAGLLRVKRFLDFECVVIRIDEGQRNENEAERSPHGYIERSTHQENMVPNGLVGSMECRVVKDVTDPVTKTVVLRADQIVTVGPGNMPHDKRKQYFENQGLLLAQTIKAKFFPKGIKDKPRFPTYVSHRAASDM